jgi:hypothetical protein
MELKPGDRVKGTISGRYIGEVVDVGRDELFVRGIDGVCFLIGRLMVECIPPVNDNGQKRQWVM